MDLILILASGVATGTVLLYATVGEIFSERSGILNLGVEGMMLVGAMSAYKTAAATDNAWLGLLVAMLAAGLISQVHNPPSRSSDQRIGIELPCDWH
jgi:simple sugar transport system permease protein